MLPGQGAQAWAQALTLLLQRPLALGLDVLQRGCQVAGQAARAVLWVQGALGARGRMRMPCLTHPRPLACPAHKAMTMVWGRADPLAEVARGEQGLRSHRLPESPRAAPKATGQTTCCEEGKTEPVLPVSPTRQPPASTFGEELRPSVATLSWEDDGAPTLAHGSELLLSLSSLAR